MALTGQTVPGETPLSEQDDSRLLADVLLEKHYGLAPFTWGGDAQLGNSDPNRQAYLDGLRAADKGNYGPLLGLCRA